MKTLKCPSQAELKALFDYNPETGILTWKVKTSKSVKIGDVAGFKNSKGHLQVGINRIKYLAHRIIWIMCEGEIPSGYEIDHINMIKNDNRLSNLRLSTSSQNGMNKNTHKDNKSGIKGLSEWADRNGTRYLSCRIATTINNKPYLKCKHFRFTESNKESQKAVAIAWLERTRAELHGEFANHGLSGCRAS